MIVDKGIRDELNLNDYGILVLIKEGNLQKNYYPVAKLRLVKLQNNTSYWIAYKFIDKKQLSVGSDYFLFTKNKMLKGRKGLDASKIKLVTTSNKTKSVLSEDRSTIKLSLPVFCTTKFMVSERPMNNASNTTSETGRLISGVPVTVRKTGISKGVFKLSLEWIITFDKCSPAGIPVALMFNGASSEKPGKTIDVSVLAEIQFGRPA